MKIVVIGGSGLIGSKLVGALLSDQTLLPGESPRIGATRFEGWLGRQSRVA